MKTWTAEEVSTSANNEWLPPEVREQLKAFADRLKLDESAEAVAYCRSDDPFNASAFAWTGTERDPAYHTDALYLHPPAQVAQVDVAAIRKACEMIQKLPHLLRCSNLVKDCLKQIDEKLSTAIGDGV